MDDGIDWDLLAKYLSGEATKEEETQVHSWAAEDARRTAILKELRRVWDLTDAPQSDSSGKQSWNVERIWRRLAEDTDLDSASASESADLALVRTPTDSSSHDQTDRPSRRRSSSRVRSSRSSRRQISVWRAAAAAVLATAAVLLGLWEYDTPTEAKSETFATEKGQRAVVRLNDGSEVHLNVDSRLVVAKEFGDRREVRLDGEAFFEVVKDSTRPFVVLTDESATRVLGTAFNVSAYPNDEDTRVVVAEGRVALKPASPSAGETATLDEKSAGGKEDSAKRQEEVVLAKGQTARMIRGESPIVRDARDVAPYLAWMNGELVFEDASFRQTVRKLERWYGLEITLRNVSIGSPAGHLNAQFDENRSLEEVLEVVATAFELEFDRPSSERVIFFLPASSDGPKSAS